MKTNWFKKRGWFYIPTSIPGVSITLLTLAFCLTVFISVDNHSHSVSDTFYGIFPFFVSAGTLLFWIAGNTSKNS